MARTLLGCVAASVSLCAQAQTGSNVTIYGVLDSGVEHVTKVGASGSSVTRVPSNTGSTPSRWGLRGSEDLGGGRRAIFVLEQGVALDTGSLGQGGRAFGRQALVGLSAPWGSVTVGRQYSMLFWTKIESELLGPNIFGVGSLDPYIANDRSDNSIAYRGKFGNVSLGLAYSLGRDAVNAGPSPAGTNCPGESATDSKACKAWSAMLKYDTAGWGASLFTDRINGAPGAFGGLSSSALSDTRTAIKGYATFGAIKVGAGLMRRNNQGSALPKSDMIFLRAAYSVTPQLLLDTDLIRLDVKNSANQATLLSVRGTYSLSKRTAVYATAGRIDNEGSLAVSVSGGGPGTAPAPGVGQTGLMAGMRLSF